MDSVSICNMALMMTGMPSITSFEEENNNAKLCKTFFPVLRDRVLRDHDWSFACAGHELQQLDEESFDPDFPIVCALPGDVIRVIELAGNYPYRRSGRRILVRELPAALVYIRRVEDASLFDDTFCEALQYLIAAEIVMSNTRDLQMVNFYRQEYEKRLAVARSIDSQENRHAIQNAPQRSRRIAARGGCTDRQHRTGRINWVEGNAGKQGED